jgi:hypothetical protein
MTATPETARDDYYEKMSTAWAAAGEDPTFIQYEDRPSKQKFPPPDDECAWVRLVFRHTFGQQTTLAPEGSRRWRRSGVTTAQLFCPLGSSLRQPERLAKILNDAVEGVRTKTGMAFLNVRINEVGPVDHWFQTNIVAEFEYDEIK